MTEEERRLAAENAQLKERIRLLEEKISFLLRRLFGAKSEKLDPGQLELLLGGGAELPGLLCRDSGVFQGEARLQSLSAAKDKARGRPRPTGRGGGQDSSSTS